MWKKEVGTIKEQVEKKKCGFILLENKVKTMENKKKDINLKYIKDFKKSND